MLMDSLHSNKVALRQEEGKYLFNTMIERAASERSCIALMAYSIPRLGQRRPNFGQSHRSGDGYDCTETRDEIWRTIGSTGDRQ